MAKLAISKNGLNNGVMRSFGVLVVISVIFGGVLAARASDNPMEKSLRGDYEGREFIVRGFPSGQRLRYDGDGKLLAGGAPGPWTLDAQVRVRQVRVQHGLLHLDCRREFIAFMGRRFSDLPAPGKELAIDLEAGSEDEAHIRAALQRVFVSPPDTLADEVPAIWKSFIRDYFARRDGLPLPPPEPLPAGVTTLKIDPSITPPRALYAPDPSYEETARQAKFQGTVVLWLVVNREGLPEDIRIERAIGMGLEEKAIEAVKTWKFQPATRNGAPVPVAINVEVNFRMY